MAELIAVEDDEAVCALVSRVLGRAGHRVRAAADGAGLRRLIAAQPADLVVLDLTLPDEDGLTLARWLRADGSEPGIVMLTALGETIDRVAGLEAGADDYIAKPFEPQELIARIEAVLRRRRPDGEPLLRCGPWRIEPSAQRLVHDDGLIVRLARSELTLLLAFVQNADRVLSRDDLLSLGSRQDDDEPLDRSIDHRIARLRVKIETRPAHPILIRTVRNRGYLYRP